MVPHTDHRCVGEGDLVAVLVPGADEHPAALGDHDTAHRRGLVCDRGVLDAVDGDGLAHVVFLGCCVVMDAPRRTPPSRRLGESGRVRGR